jgi:2-amino-4-hydroxy-6-hydroxymethyldihydropteridine diphosphokinase
MAGMLPDGPVTAYVGLGANLGDRIVSLREAVRLLGSGQGILVKRCSPVYETEPVGGPPQGRFLNAVLAMEIDLAPELLLERCKAVENAMGRERIEHWGPRTIDIDILLYGDSIVRSKTLVIPHPRMHERAFVLAPFADLAPGVVHPVLGVTVNELLDRTGRVGIRLTSHRLVS